MINGYGVGGVGAHAHTPHRYPAAFGVIIDHGSGHVGMGRPVGAYRIRPTNGASGDERSNRWPGT